MPFWRRKKESQPKVVEDPRPAPKKGDPYYGDVVRVNDPNVVRWPGLYAVDPKTRGILVNRPIVGDRKRGFKHG